ncbi:MAG TPA: MBL fold metallo-hydrolase [Ktedonobacterales bacterium]|nr:MBL fold metallo-hydrolase [Ktedonobacterales bacterium]
MRIEQFFIEGLGHQSYLVVDEHSHVAAVVDPRRDVEVYLQTADAANAQIAWVFETHVHNDYITGALELRERTGATIVSAASAGLAYEHRGVRDGDRITVGALAFVVLATPGHTPDHLSYALYDEGRDTPTALFTGGSMLVGSAGRTDLVSPGMTLTLTRDQYHSLRRLLDTMPDDALVYPTHGAGSFCGATMDGPSARRSTIGQERLASPASHVHDEAEFVRQQLAGYGVYPAYYRYMSEINLAGPRILGGLPELPPLTAPQVRNYLDHGLPLIDGRRRRAFAREHVPGALNIELDGSFGAYVGWLLPFNKPLMLLIEDEAGRKEAVTQLIRIGYERLRGHLDGGMDAWKSAGFPTGSYEAITVEEFRQRLADHEPLAVLDVRDETEWESGHIPGSHHIHIGDLMQHLHEIPPDMPVATICRSGHRAAMAASIVAALGRETVAVRRGGVPDWLAMEAEQTSHASGHDHP